MLRYSDRIHGTDRLLRIRRIRNVVFVGILSLTLILIAARLGDAGTSLKPLFVPVHGIIEVGLIMGLVTAFVGLYLRLLEIRFAQRDNHRYMMAKSSMIRAFRTAGFAIGLAVVLLLAFTPSLLVAIVSEPPQVITLGPKNQETVTFTSPDPLGISFVTSAVFTLTEGEAVVTLLKNDDPVTTTAPIVAPGRDSVEIEPTNWAGLASWSLVFQNPSDAMTNVIFVLNKGVVPTFFSTVPFLLFLYGGAQIPWWVVLRPIRERTKASSLVSAASVLESGEQVFERRPLPEYSENPGPRSRSMALNFVPGPASTTPLADVPAARAPPRPLPLPPSPSLVVDPPMSPVRTTAVRPPPREAETPQDLVRKAQGLLTSGEDEEALDTFDAALRLDPSHGPATEGRASCLLRLGRRGEALEAYQRILERDPYHVTALRALGGIHADERRWREALDTVDRLLDLRPNDGRALERRGDALTNLGRRPEALTAYEAAAAVNPSDETLRQKIEEARVDIPGLLSRALIASAHGNYAHACALFDEILEVDPTNVNALIGKAVAHRRDGKPQEALNCLDLVLGVQPNNASALLHRGNLLAETGDAAGALEAFDRLSDLYPADESAWAARAEALLMLGREDDALRAFAAALKLSPGDEEIRRHVRELEAAKIVQSEFFQDLVAIKGIGKARAKALLDAGFRSAEDLARASPSDLLAVRGITRAIVEELRGHFGRAREAAARTSS